MEMIIEGQGGGRTGSGGGNHVNVSLFGSSGLLLEASGCVYSYCTVHVVAPNPIFRKTYTGSAGGKSQHRKSQAFTVVQPAVCVGFSALVPSLGSKNGLAIIAKSKALAKLEVCLRSFPKEESKEARFSEAFLSPSANFFL